MQGHGPGQKTIVSGRRHVGITAVEPVGHYAVRLIFDDLHDTGIYTWDTLHRLGREHRGALGGVRGRPGRPGAVAGPPGAERGLAPSQAGRRARSAAASVPSSSTSSAPPIGTPCASRVTGTESGRSRSTR